MTPPGPPGGVFRCWQGFVAGANLPACAVLPQFLGELVTDAWAPNVISSPWI